MKLKLITKVLILCSKPEKLRERMFHSLSSCLLLVGGRSLLSEQHSWIFLGSFLASPLA